MAQSIKNLSLFPGDPGSRPAGRSVPRSPGALGQTRESRLWLAVCLHDLIIEASPIAGSRSPAVVAHSDDAHIAAANPAARALGIEAGCALDTALAMADGLQVETRDIPGEQQALRSLSIWARTLTPTVSIVAPNVLLLEIRGSLKLFGGADRIKAAVRARLLRHRLSARISLAPSAQAATWLSRHLECDVEDERQLAGSLRALPLSVTDWPYTLRARLAEMGIRRIGDLLRLPRDGLALRIGRVRVQEIDRAMGRAFEQRALTQLPQRRQWSIELPGETNDRAMLIEGCEVLFDQLMDELRERQKQISRFTVHFSHLHRQASQETFELLAPTYDKQRLLDLLSDRLERLSLPAPVIALALHTGELSDLFVDTPELFACAEKQVADTGMIERLRERCGPKSVYGIALAEDHRPESAWSMQFREAAGDTVVCPWEGERPLWLLLQPRPCDASNLQIELGPERIESGWWDGRPVNRDYYIARPGSGERLWVYFDHRGQRWYLHGVFG